jgi:hypothetical protein
MDQNLLDTIDKMLLVNAKANESLSQGMLQVVEAIQAKRTAFAEKKKTIEKDIERGAKLTNHRISL